MPTKISSSAALLPIYCCDSDSLINLKDAGLLDKLRDLVKLEKIKVPEGVYRELHRYTDKLAKNLQQWDSKYHLVIQLDSKSLDLLTSIERQYGPSFHIGSKVYGGFWNSASGRKSSDGQVVALAKSRGWIVVSNDDSIHGACMLEGVTCRRWEEIGRLILNPEQSPLPGF
jgi:hypothetical protein